MYPKIILFHPIFFGEGTRLNFGEIVAILSATPTISCSAERLFSVLRRTKTNLRSRMGLDHLSHLALLCIEHGYVNKSGYCKSDW